MRDVALVSFAYSAVDKDPVHNEVEMIVPVVREAVAQSGLPRAEIEFTVSGSLDYLQGGPFAFVSGLDAVGAWPPIRESHVEMDAAWALYEAWVAIQTGEVDSALVYGFGKSSMSDLHEVMTLQTDPYYVAPLWPSMVDMAALQARAYLEDIGPRRTRSRRGRRTRAQRNGQQNPNAVRKGDVTADALLAAPVTHDPLRDADIAPITDGAVAVVLAAGDLARSVCERPAWIKGIEHRIEAHGLGVRDLTESVSTRDAAARGRCDRRVRRRGAARAVQPRRADPGRGARAEREHEHQPVRWSARREPGDERGPDPHRRSRPPHLGRRSRPRGRARHERPVPATEPGRRLGRCVTDGRADAVEPRQP